MKRKTSFPLAILMILSLEKFVQHMYVTYAFMEDLGNIRQFVTLDYRIFMISGFLVGLLFLVSFVLMVRRNRSGLNLLLGLALFDFIGEFVAQGTLFIAIPLSFIVASLIIVVLLVTKNSLVQEDEALHSGTN
ncbi:MAG: hypothetical protein H3C34_00735 [Caldilineaceae bacterium]|nr:hypothetical protein [Caldilineaceae bacterium]